MSRYLSQPKLDSRYVYIEPQKEFPKLQRINPQDKRYHGLDGKPFVQTPPKGPSMWDRIKSFGRGAKNLAPFIGGAIGAVGGAGAGLYTAGPAGIVPGFLTGGQTGFGVGAKVKRWGDKAEEQVGKYKRKYDELQEDYSRLRNDPFDYASKWIPQDYQDPYNYIRNDPYGYAYDRYNDYGYGYNGYDYDYNDYGYNDYY